MKIRTRTFIIFFLLVMVGFYFFAKWILDDVRKTYLESLEENMVDTANILSGIISNDISDEKIQTGNFESAFKSINGRKLSAKIYQLVKTEIDLKVYITDARGIVIFDSDQGRRLGQDFSQWRDVYLTLKGKYGARSTRIDKENPSSSIIHVAAPITANGGKIIGVLTVYKPINFISQFIYNTKQKIILNAAVVILIVLVLGFIFSAWLTQPILLLTNYIRSLRDGEKASMPKLGRGEIGVLGKAFEEMREALEGKKYVEQYVQHLTHEFKSPLSAIQGAVELLKDHNLPPQKHQKFLSNIRIEAERMHQLIDRMLQLSMLENRKGLKNIEEIDIVEMTRELVKNYREFSICKILFSGPSEPLIVKGERFLIYQALDNLIRNAIDFTAEEGNISVSVEEKNNHAEITIEDSGTGIPDYALDRIFEKFYSLPRPGTNTKSSGLGLSIVKEIVELHHGKIELGNRGEKSGVRAILTLPRKNV